MQHSRQPTRSIKRKLSRPSTLGSNNSRLPNYLVLPLSSNSEEWICTLSFSKACNRLLHQICSHRWIWPDGGHRRTILQCGSLRSLCQGPHIRCSLLHFDRWRILKWCTSKTSLMQRLELTLTFNFHCRWQCPQSNESTLPWRTPNLCCFRMKATAFNRESVKN